MTTTIIYADLLFLTNLLLDFVLLFAVSRFGNFRAGAGRLLLVSILAAACSVLLLATGLARLNGVAAKLVLSALLVLLAFPTARKRRFFVALAYFYLIGFAMAGAVVGCTYLGRDLGLTGLTYSYTAAGLSAALLLCLLLARYGVEFIKHNLRAGAATEELAIELDGKTVTVTALFDTGNELYDPLSHRPVIVVELSAMRSLLPAALAAALDSEPDVAAVMAALTGDDCCRRLRLVPYSSIGKSNGLLLAIKPDRVRLPDRRGAVIPHAVVGLYPGAIMSRDHCRGIVNPAILDSIQI